MLRIKEYSKQVLVVVISTLMALFVFEIALRVQNSFISPLYDIEMWRYSKELKQRSDNEDISHIHVKNATAELQRVTIMTNDNGARGASIEQKYKPEKSILFIGSSIVLGWGVPQQDTMSEQVRKMAKKDGLNWHVVNAGVGNYNAKRAITNYLENLQSDEWDTIVYGYFVNDAEELKTNTGNFFTRNFAIGVLGWKFFSALNYEGHSISEYYTDIYHEDAKGYQDMMLSLSNLSNHCKNSRKRCVLAMIPDVHQMQPYQLQFIHDRMKLLAEEHDFEYLDLLPSLTNYEAKMLWNEYQDPHPNAFAHQKMAVDIYNTLRNGT